MSLQPFSDQNSQLPIEHGSLLQFSEDPIACMKRLRQRFGDLAVLREQQQNLTFVFSPELNRQVLSDSTLFQSQFFAVRGNRRSAQRRVTSGLLSQNGSEHRDSRRALKDVFSLRALPGYHRVICDLSTRLTAAWETQSQVDLNSEMVQFMLQMTSAILFGDDDAEFAEHLGELIDKWTHHNHRVGMGALVSAPRFAREYEHLLEQAEHLDESIRDLFHRHRGRPGTNTNVLSLLLNASGDQQSLSDDALIGHATLLFAAAHLTTAHTFSWTLFLLAQHPEIMSAVKDELQRSVAGDVPSLEELNQVPVLDAVIRESMRVLPASSYSQRVTSAAAQLGCLHLPPGSPVIFSQYITHHRSDLFPDPDRFHPDRWRSISPSPYAYLPFGAGPRMCIGAPLAMTEIRTALIIMLKKFSFAIEENATVNGRVISTMLGPTSSIPAKLLPPDEVADTVPVQGSIHSLLSLPAAAYPKSTTARRAA